MFGFNSMFDAMGGKAGIAGTVIGTAIGGGLAKATMMASNLGTEYKDATDSIRVGTGATGDRLGELEQSFRNVAGRVKEDIGLTAQVMADLNTRTGLTGQALEDLTVDVIEFSRVTGTGAVQNVADLTRVFGDWGIATDDQTETMDQLLRASQATGIGMNELMQKVVTFGAPMRSLGLSFEESIALLGKWEKEGVNTETMLSGLRMAVANFAKAGIDPREGLPALIKEIQGLDDAQGLLRAKQIVGQRAANDFFRAVKEGRFDVEDLTDAIINGSESVDSAVEDTRRFTDGIAEMKNKVKVAIGPIVEDFAGLAGELGNAIYLLPALGGVVGNVTGRLWAKHAALLANNQAAGSYKSSLLGVGAAVGVFAAGVMVANEAGKGMTQEYNNATEAIEGMTEATPEQIAQLREAGHAAIERSQALKFMGFWDTEASSALENTGRVSLETADRLEAGGDAAQGLGEDMQGVAEAAEDMAAQLFGVLSSLSTDFEMTDAAAEQLAERFGLTAEQVKTVWGAMGDDLEAGAQRVRDFLTTLPADFEMTAKAAQDLAHLLGVSMDTVLEEWARSGRDGARGFVKSVVEEWPKKPFWLSAFGSLRDAAQETAEEVPRDVAGALRRGEGTVESAMEDLMEVMANPMKRQTKLNEIEGELMGIHLARGLNSADPAVRAQALRTQGILIAEWEALAGIAWDAGNRAGNRMTQALRSSVDFRPAAAKLRRQMELLSPAKEGPWSERGGPIEWMRRNAERMSEVFNRTLRDGLGGVGALPLTPAPAMQPAMAMAGGGGVTNNYNITVPVEGLLRAETPEDVGRVMLRAARLGLG